MAVESKRLQVLGEISELMKNASHVIRIILVSLRCVFPSLWGCSIPAVCFSPLLFAPWKTSTDDIESFWVIKGNCIKSIRIVPSRHTLINLWWKLETVCIYLSRWKRGILRCSSALPFHIFLKSWFLGLYYTTKIQKNVIARLYHDYTILNLYYIPYMHKVF